LLVFNSFINLYGILFLTFIFTICSQIFEPFGPVELVQLPLDLETSQCKGFGFVQVSDYFSWIASKILCLLVDAYLFVLYFIVCSSRTCKGSSKFEWEVGDCWSNYQGRHLFFSNQNWTLQVSRDA
jgi:hypothetical protein